MTDRPSGAPGGTQQSLGRYHIGEPLGGGPTGEVFRAKVVGVAGYERQYALKRFHAALAQSPAAAEILASAARSYATIAHPHIARLSEYGVAQGQSFVAVEMVAGLDVARLVAASAAVGDPIPRGALLTMVAQVTRGVAYAHARGVLHLGLCPTNVIVSTDGDPKVTDFGLLRARLRVRPVDDPTLLARMPYMAPEQLDGVEGTALADVFSLATVAYEILLGERAFSAGNGPEIAAAILAGPPAQGDLPGPVWDVLAKAFARDPTARYTSAGAFADAFDAVVKRLALPGGRADLAAAVKRAQGRTADLAAGNMSGALSFPLPAPPPSVPGVALSSLFPGGEVPRRPKMGRPTMNAVVVPPASGAVRPAPPPPTPMATPVPVGPSRHVEEITATGDYHKVPSSQVRAVTSPPPRPPTPPPVPLTPAPLDPPPAGPPPSQPIAPVAYGQTPPTQKNRPKRTTMPPPIPPEAAPAATPPPPGPAPVVMPLEDVMSLPARRSRWPIGVLVVAALGAGAYLVYDQMTGSGSVASATDGGARVTAAAPPDGAAQAATVTTPDAAAPIAAAVKPVAPPPSVPDAAPVAAAVVTPDARPVVAAVVPTRPDAAPAAPPIAEPPPVTATHAPAAEGKLLILSTPPGAEAFLDGAAKGKTPVELPASGDRHKLALILPGHKLARLDIDGRGRTEVELQPVAKLRGPAGIKVQCSTRGRLYITVDGVDTGLMCPTERIGVSVGEHTVGTYDPQSEEVSVQKVQVKDTHFSARVRVP